VATVRPAVVAGYEIMCRIGVAADPAREYANGFHPTGTSGVFGAAAAAAMRLGGGGAAVAAALGIAGSMSAGSMSFLTNGSWTKHLHPGWAAHGGIVAARLALDGYRAPEAVLEPPLGHLSRRDDETTGPLLDGLGTTPLAIERTSVKAHGCCRYEQSAVDAVLHLRRDHDVAPDDVAGVEVSVLDAAWNIVAAPAEQKVRPRTAVEAQFSMPFGVAVALTRGSASVREHTDETANDAAIRDLMARVTCVRDAELDALYPERWPARVAIELRDGARLAHRVDHPKGDPENPFTLDEMLERLHDIARDAPERLRDELADALLAPGEDQTLAPVGTTLANLWKTTEPAPAPAAAT
jgi:2-methylcitrate dehydratase PrpD